MSICKVRGSWTDNTREREFLYVVVRSLTIPSPALSSLLFPFFFFVIVGLLFAKVLEKIQFSTEWLPLPPQGQLTPAKESQFIVSSLK